MLALRYSWRFAFLLISALTTLGCGGGGDRYDTVPVSGIVTCNGKPVANGVINFTPMAEQGRSEGNRGRVALSKTDSNGRFKLTTYENEDGAIVGRHTVTISMGFSEEAGSVDGVIAGPKVALSTSNYVAMHHHRAHELVGGIHVFTGGFGQQSKTRMNDISDYYLSARVC